MSLTRTIKEPDMTGASQVGTASGKVFTRGNIVNTCLRCLTSSDVELTRAQILNDISDITVKVNGIPIIDADATYLLDRQKFLGDAVGAGNIDGIIPISFELEHLPSTQERRVSALGTAGVNTITIEVKVIAVAQLAKIEIYTEVDNEPIRRPGQHIRINKFNRTFGSTGTFEISDLPFQDVNVAGYLEMNFKYSTGSLDQVTVKRNGLVVVDKLPSKLNDVLNDRALRTNQSGYYNLSFARSRDLASLLPMDGTSSLLLETEWSSAAPNTFQIYTERVFRELR